MFLLCLVVALCAITFETIFAKAGSNAKSLDFWFVKKGSLVVPSGMKIVKLEDNPQKTDQALGTMSNSVVYILKSSTQKFQGIVKMGAICCNDSAEAKEQCSIIKPTKDDPGLMGPITRSSVSISKVDKGSYKAEKWTSYRYKTSPDDHFKEGERIVETIYFLGNKTVYKSGMRYSGLEVYPTYWIMIERDKNDKNQAAKVKEILSSLKLP